MTAFLILILSAAIVKAAFASEAQKLDSSVSGSDGGNNLMQKRVSVVKQQASSQAVLKESENQHAESTSERCDLADSLRAELSHSENWQETLAELVHARSELANLEHAELALVEKLEKTYVQNEDGGEDLARSKSAELTAVQAKAEDVRARSATVADKAQVSIDVLRREIDAAKLREFRDHRELEALTAEAEEAPESAVDYVRMVVSFAFGMLMIEVIASACRLAGCCPARTAGAIT